MRRVLVLFSSQHGQTRTVAFRVAETLRAHGEHVHLRDIHDEDADPVHFDAVVIGSPIHMSHHDREITRWAKRHRDALASRPGAFFSVSLAAASKRPEAASHLRADLERFFLQTGWRPPLVATVAGALRYTRYSWLVKRIMRAIVRVDGLGRDVARDDEYTDWAQVDAFSHDVLAMIAPEAACRRAA
jgi:menaquinone-dependent protoporphyrinogen oxidase